MESEGRRAAPGRGPGLVTALLLAPTTAWYLLLLIVPLGILIVFSFGTRSDVGGYTPGRPRSFSGSSTTTCR